MTLEIAKLGYRTEKSPKKGLGDNSLEAKVERGEGVNNITKKGLQNTLFPNPVFMFWQGVL